MSTKKLIEKIMSNNENVSKMEASEAVTFVVKAISDVLEEGEEINLINFGKFSVKTVPERKGRNPKTGEEITIKERKRPVFKPGSRLKEKVNKGVNHED